MGPVRLYYDFSSDFFHNYYHRKFFNETLEKAQRQAKVFAKEKLETALTKAFPTLPAPKTKTFS